MPVVVSNTLFGCLTGNRRDQILFSSSSQENSHLIIKDIHSKAGQESIQTLLSKVLVQKLEGLS